MVTYCTVCMNNTRKKKDISYFNYPKESNRRYKWLKAVGREDLVLKITVDNTRQRYRICEDHFERSNIFFSTNKTKKYLYVNAFPTLNLPSNNGVNSSHCETVSTQENQDIPIMPTTQLCSSSNIVVLQDQTCRSIQTDPTKQTNESRAVQTALHLLADNPRKRKVSPELREAKKKYETKEDFLILCDKFRTKVKEVKLKWKKLRDSYRDALKRQSEVAAGGKRGSAWKYTHLMHFLQPHMNARKKPPFAPAAPREPSAEVGEGERVNGHEESEDSCSSRSSTPRRRRTRPAPVKRPLSPRHIELPDPLDIFFNSMCQSTKRLPYPAQIRIKKALFAAVIEAEEGLLAEQQSYAALWARGAASTSGSEPAGQQDDVKPYA